jgi:regulator of replication initiation timing
MSKKKTLEELMDFVQHMESYGTQLEVENSNLRQRIKKLEEANERGNQILMEQRGIIGFLEAKLVRMTEMYEGARDA